MKKIAVLFMIVLVGVTISCTNRAKGNNGKNDKKDELVVPVQAETLKRGQISAFVLSSATLEAEMSVDIVAETSGVVEKLYVEEGDHVEKGKVLAVVNFSELKLSKEKAEVALQEAENNFNRLKSMFDRQLVSQEDFDNAKFNFNQKKLDFENANVKYEKSMIKAPFSGTITERFITVGQYLSMNQKVFSLVNQDVLKVNVFIPEERIRDVRVGMSAKVISEATNLTFEGTVKRVSHVVDPATGTVKVTIYVRPDNNVRPGMFVKVRILTDTLKNALLVPKKAVVYQEDRRYIFIYQPKDEVAKRYELKSGYQNDTYFQCLNPDLKAGEDIIVAGQNGLKDGAKVRLGDNG